LALSLHLQKLKVLQARNLQLDITDLVALDELALWNSSVVAGRGRLRGLRKLAGDATAFLDEDFSQFNRLRWVTYLDVPQQIAAAQVSRLLSFPAVDLTGLRGARTLAVGQGVRRLSLQECLFVSLEMRSGGRGLVEANLTGSSVSDSSLPLLAGCQRVTLDHCWKLRDVSCLRQVPHISLVCCKGIADFTALGAARFLDLTGCDGLTDQQLGHLGEVRRLNISSCPAVSDLSVLRNNLFLLAEGCQRLRRAEVVCRAARLVSLARCLALQEVAVSGRVRVLRVSRSQQFELYGREHVDFLDEQLFSTLPAHQF
jgi:hypothetical protein